MVSRAIGNDTFQVASSAAVKTSMKGRYTHHSLTDEPIGGGHSQSGELSGESESQSCLVSPQAEERTQLIVDVVDPFGEIKSACPGFQDFAHSAACEI